MAKVSKLVKVSKFLKSEGFEVSVTEIREYTSLTAKRGECEVFIMSHKCSEYFTVCFTLNDEVVKFTVDEAMEGFGTCKTQNDVIRDITALISKADEIKGAEIAEAIDEAIEALDAVEVVRTEGLMLFDTIKKAFPHLQVANPLTTIISERPEMINYNFDVIKALGHSVIIRVYRDKISLISYNNGDTNILYFEPKQHDDVIQALEAHFPNQLTAEALEAEGLQVVEDIQEAIYITPEGVLIGGEFDCGMRGVDHRIISYLVPVNPYEDHTAFWNYVHENLGLVRLVPETMTALIGIKQALTKVQIDTLMSSGYQIEAY